MGSYFGGYEGVAGGSHFSPLAYTHLKEDRFHAKRNRSFLFAIFSYRNALDILTKFDLTSTLYISNTFDMRWRIGKCIRDTREDI